MKGVWRCFYGSFKGIIDTGGDNNYSHHTVNRLKHSKSVRRRGQHNLDVDITALKKNQREKIEEQLAGAATVSDSATSESEKTSRELQKYSSFIPALVLVQTLWIHKIRLKRNLHTCW